jgi:hypothetical protein
VKRAKSNPFERYFIIKRKMAERKGFEPPERVSPFNDLANRRLQPLGHLSAK